MQSLFTFGLWNAVAVLLVGAAFSPAFNDSHIAPKFFLLTFFVLAGFPLLCLHWLRTGKIAFRQGVLPWTALAFLGVLVLRSFLSPALFLSQFKTFEYFVWMAFLFWVWLSLSADEQARGKPSACIVLNAMEILSVPAVAYAFIQHFGRDPVHWAYRGGRVFSLMTNPEAFGSCLAALTALSAVRFIKQPELWRAVLIACDIAAVFWSGERGPVVGLLAGGMTTALPLVVLRLRDVRHSEAKGREIPLPCPAGSASSLAITCAVISKNRSLAAVGMTLLAVFAALVFSRGGSAVMGRYSPAFWRTDPDVLGRIHLFRKGVEVLALHPWGVGAGNFTRAYLPLRNDDPAFYKTRLAVGESTHNTFLDVFDETGWIGGTLFVGIWLSAMFALMRFLARVHFKTFSIAKLSLMGPAAPSRPEEVVPTAEHSERLLRPSRVRHPFAKDYDNVGFEMNSSQEEAFFGLSVLIPTIVLFVSLQFFYPEPVTEALSGAFLALSLFADSGRLKTVSLPRPAARGLFVLSLLLLVFGGVYSTRRLAADFHAGKGNRAFDNKAWAAASGEYFSAVLWNPWDADYYGKLGRSYENGGNPVGALWSYNHAVKLADWNAFYWADIGRLAARNHWRRRCLTAYAKAVRRDPYNSGLYHDAALSALNLRAYGMARTFAAEALHLNPADADDARYYSLAVKALQAGDAREILEKAHGEK